MTIMHHTAEVKVPLNMSPLDIRPAQVIATPSANPSIMKWLTYSEVAVKCTNDQITLSLKEKEDLFAKELLAKKRQRRIRKAALIIGSLLLIGLVLGWIGLREAHRASGMTFSIRHESFPLVLPQGTPHLRTVSLLMSNMQRGMRKFTPFIATSQKNGMVTILTNETTPSYSAYSVSHPDIDNVVMISDDLFCSPKTCFYIKDVNNEKYFPTTEFRPRAPIDLSSQTVKVPLPPNMTFVKAEYCAYLMSRHCRILMKSTTGKEHFGMVLMPASSLYRNLPPSINDTGAIEPWPTSHPVVEVKAFRTFNERIQAFRTFDTVTIYWYGGKLAVAKNYRNKAIIDDVDQDEIVELLDISKSIQIVIVMKEEEGTTRVRIYAINDAYKVIRQDELRLSSPPSAITILERGDTFEICEIIEGAKLTCHANVVQKQ